ncbi:hypothetical protein [Pararhizobium sp. PWRC1-1]|uniref:hypothetical protein n=1 Tax=Pararhizobium sp. PWRC1-1 TaxID=2804566 RepID=UPI003CEC03FC
MSTPVERRERWEKSVAHKLEHGLRSERDPAFLAWIEEWIAGDISIKEVQERYAALLLSRDKTGLSSDDTVLMEEIREQFPEIRDVRTRRAVERTKTTRAIEAAWKLEE